MDKKNYFLLLIGIFFFVNNIFSATCNVNGNTTYQTISGFGASSAWSEWSGCSCGTNTFLVNNAAQFFNVNTGIGLNIIRARIPPDTSQWGSTAAPLQAARDQGAIVMATAWTPPAQWKSNGAVHNSDGGYLLPQYYQNYADYLVNYINTMRNNYNVTIYAISPANEPDYQVSYDGCSWTGAQLRDFIKNNLGPTFAANNITTKILVPESYRNDCAYADTILGDATARNYVFGIAQHIYGGGPTYCSAVGTYSKEFWQTERSSFEAYDATMTHGLTTAGWIHNCLVNANYNAFLYWWLASDQNNEGLRGVNNGIPKRFWVMGNFSKFIRPGYIRIAADASPATNVNVSAYKSSNSSTYVIVAINRNTSATSITFSLSNITATSFTPWITSSSYDLAQQAAVAVSGGSFTYNLPAQSVVSFVGSGVAGTPTRTFTNTPYAGTPTFTRTHTSTPVSVLLDDMEDGNTTNNWGGAWYSYSGTGTTITPKPFVMTAGGMTGSALYRAQIQATVADYAGMGTNLSPSETAVDLTAYVAVEFWVMGNGGTYWFQFTQPSITDGDHFGVTFTAPSTWTKVTVPINASALSQRGFGAPSTFTPGSIVALQWASYSNGALDIRVDNVQFLTYYPPTPTRTPTLTTMPSATWTRTITITPTRTGTSTNTITSTTTRTNTPVSTSTYTWTPTSIITSTFTSSRTMTSTYTGTPSLTLTMTPTRTNTPVSTSTYTWTPTSVITSTFTPSRTVTTTFTQSNTPTSTNTSVPSLPATYTSTRTGTPTLSWTGTQTPTWTRTISPTYSVTLTNSPTITSTSTWTITRTVTTSSTITQTLTGTPPSVTNTSTITNTIIITVAYTYTRTVTPTFTQTSIPTSTNTFVITSTFTASSTRTVTSTFTATTTWTGNITLTFTRTPTETFTVTDTISSNTPTMTPTYTRTWTNTWTSTITLTWTPTSTRTFTTTWTMTVTPTWTMTASATRTITPSYTVTLTVTSTRTSTLLPTATRTVTSTATITVIPDKDIFNIENIVILSNPYNPAKGDLKIRLDLTQASKIIKVRIFTSGFRLVKQITQSGDYTVGTNIITIESKYLTGLANGAYYIILTAINNSGGVINSKPIILLILK